MASRFPKPLIADGARFGLWTVLQFAGRRPRASGRTVPLYLCRCDCGTERIVLGRDLLTGHTKSCGCNRAAAIAASMTRHGHAATRSRAYKIWCDMIRRCDSEKHVSFKYYGGKGIRVCDKWRLFERFLADMGEPPPGTWIDRIDSDGHYEKANCRWATPQQQQNNRSNNVMVTYKGETMTTAELARRTGQPAHRVQERLKNGRTAEEAVQPGRLPHRMGRK